MKSISNIFKSILLMNILVSCSYEANKSDIIGCWTCDVIYPNMAGQELITCSDDSSVSIIDSLLYTVEEDSVKIDVKCSIANSGRWMLKDNELEFSLTNVVVEMDTSSLNISTSSHDFSIDSLSNNYLLVKQELCRQIKSDINTYFKAGTKKEIKIGRIKEYTGTRIIIENTAGELVLERVPETLVYLKK